MTHWGHRIGPLFAPLLAALVGAPPSTAVWGRLPDALHKNGTDYFLARCVPGGDVKEFLRILWLATAMLVH
jgi:hypothetical protein